MSSLDLNATMLAALGCPALPRSRGRNTLAMLSGTTAEWEDVAFSEYCLDEGHYHRMVRRDEWKLNYYHGMEPQLFNLREDPDKLQDYAGDSACTKIRAALEREVLASWNPEAVARRMRARRADRHLIDQWAKKVKPTD